MPPTFEGPRGHGHRHRRRRPRATGLRAGTPVVAGGGDQAANAVGVGVVDPGTMALSLGTSGVVFAATDRPIHEPRGIVHAFCHAVPDRWHLMSVMLSAAGSLRWFRDALAPGEEFGDARRAAAEVRPGSDGLLFLPYLTGRAQPAPGPARPRRVRRAHRDPRPAPPDAGRPGGRGVRPARRPRPDDRRRDAGARRRSGRRAAGTASPLWRQILADVLDAEIATVDTTEGAAYGAGLLAAVGAGWFPSVGGGGRGARSTRRRSPSPGPDAPRYAEAHAALSRALPGPGADLPAWPAERAGARPSPG